MTDHIAETYVVWPTAGRHRFALSHRLLRKYWRIYGVAVENESQVFTLTHVALIMDAEPEWVLAVFAGCIPDDALDGLVRAFVAECPEAFDGYTPG